jgi:hypothetical protein
VAKTFGELALRHDPAMKLLHASEIFHGAGRSGGRRWGTTRSFKMTDDLFATDESNEERLKQDVLNRWPSLLEIVC